MPSSPSSSVMAEEAAAVVPKLGSENHTPGRSLAHGPESTPPLTIGISTDSPVRLSVMVTLSATVPATPSRCPRKSTSGADRIVASQAGDKRDRRRRQKYRHCSQRRVVVAPSGQLLSFGGEHIERPGHLGPCIGRVD